MQITKEIRVHAGHCVTSQQDKNGKPGKCSQAIHGHTYRIVATIDGEPVIDNLPNGGMIIDYGDLKQAMMDIIYDEADHACYLWENDPGVHAFRAFANAPGKNPKKHIVTSFIPTAENLAAYWFKLLENHLEMKYHIKLQSLQVYETPTSSAIYSRPVSTSDVKIPTRLVVDGDVVVHGNLTVDDSITSVRFNSDFKPAALEERE